ncbi:ATP-dependent endonuclease [Chitinophaga sp. sic0106]|uniref:ATP-dependent nuclease n=1 Tax=Chitinophaga sp. sic0106 TaxID=2854785 RepID=UPI001C465ECA|nr:ATP-binding protein [Chitinophaga sp. sic0106]MBV7529458.1 AAA family ATPase [Chitinophaga sp. sic0106]
MKVSRITIKDFHQFKDLDLDLTYPAGHPKAGKPLDKVCFIGQSGTGKTTLLEMIPLFTSRYHTKSFPEESLDYINQVSINLSYGHEAEYNVKISDVEQDIRFWEVNDSEAIYQKRTATNQDFLAYYKEEWVKKVASKVVYFPANLNFEIDDIGFQHYNYGKIVDFSKSKVSTVWNLLLDSIQKYQEHELQLRQDISRTVEHASTDLDSIKSALNRLEEWKKNEFNPIADVADNCLDPLLANFKLRVKREFHFNTRGDIGFIKIEDFQNNEIPEHLWSTGTKQVVLSALPLYLLKPKNTIILFDEPERSLYPDLQRLIINYYESLTNNCQFFYSTHSPVIASSFDPWEIVELKFNEPGHIYREVYYDGENHVDNYHLNPKTMRWDDILQRIFDLENDGSDFRKQKLDELATLNVKFRKLLDGGEAESGPAKALRSQIQKLSEELSKWD